jgi:two-component sensor histidine kinase
VLRGDHPECEATVVPDLAASPGVLRPEPLSLVRRHLDPTAQAAGAGRSFLADALTRWGHDDDVPVAALIANELITNAIVHARTPIDLTVSLRGSTLSVAVADGSENPIAPVSADELDEHGRGLALVAGLAVRWGMLPRDPRGKVVWAIVRKGASDLCEDAVRSTE